MQSFLNRFKSLLGSSPASLLCFLLAIACKLLYLRYYLGSGADKFAQTALTHNFLNGHGFRLHVAFAEDLSKVGFLPDVGWPPGYSWLLAIIMPFTGTHYALAWYIADIVSALLFLWFCRRLLLLIDFPAWLINLFLLLQGAANFRHTQGSPPTDLLSLGLLVASLYYVLRIIKAPGFSWKPVLWLCLFMLLACFVRYQNFPVCILVSLVLCVTGWKGQHKPWFRSGLVTMVGLFLFFGGFLLYQFFESGSAFYVEPAKKGFYLSNLLSACPFALSGTINVKFFGVQAGLLSGMSYPTWGKVVVLIGLPLSVLFSVVVVWYLLKKSWLKQSLLQWFLFFGSFIFLGMIGLLVVLSLLIDNQIGPPTNQWTYIQEARYYYFPIFFMQACLWWFLFARQRSYVNWGIRLARWGYGFLMAVALLHGLYFALRRAHHMPYSLERIPYESPEQAFVIDFIQDLQKREPERQVVVTGFHKRYAFLADLYGSAGLFGPLTLNKQAPRSSRPAVLLLVLHERELPLMTSYLSLPNVKQVFSAEHYLVFALYV